MRTNSCSIAFTQSSKTPHFYLTSTKTSHFYFSIAIRSSRFQRKSIKFAFSKNVKFSKNTRSICKNLLIRGNMVIRLGFHNSILKESLPHPIKTKTSIILKWRILMTLMRNRSKKKRNKIMVKFCQRRRVSNLLLTSRRRRKHHDYQV